VATGSAVIVNDQLLTDVAELLRETGEREILPRFRLLRDDEIREKAPGELVTVADGAAEARLLASLGALIPGAPFVAEESWGPDSTRFSELAEAEAVWVVDPLDGTRNFAAGEPSFAIMVALLRRGETVASWIHAPVDGWTVTAQHGAGAELGGDRLHVSKRTEPSSMHGAIHDHFMPPDLRRRVNEALPSIGRSSTTGCAAHEYVQVARGIKDFALYYRTLPWDHVPGDLIVREAGGTVRQYDGRPFEPLAARPGLLAAPNAAAWDALHALFIGN